MKETPKHLQKFVLQIHHKIDIQGIILQLHNNFVLRKTTPLSCKCTSIFFQFRKVHVKN